MSPSVQDLVQRLEPYPTLVKGRRWDVLTANPAARELFGDWSGGGEGNLVRWMFTSDRAREIYLEWEPEARAMLGRFRLAAARHPDDPLLAELIAGLIAGQPARPRLVASPRRHPHRRGRAPRSSATRASARSSTPTSSSR